MRFEPLRASTNMLHNNEALPMSPRPYSIIDAKEIWMIGCLTLRPWHNFRLSVATISALLPIILEFYFLVGNILVFNVTSLPSFMSNPSIMVNLMNFRKHIHCAFSVVHLAIISDDLNYSGTPNGNRPYPYILEQALSLRLWWYFFLSLFISSHCEVSLTLAGSIPWEMILYIRCYIKSFFFP